MKTIVVTGGLGFIGSNLINILSKRNNFIINIDKVNYASNLNNISKNIKNYRFYKQNINNQNFIKKILYKYNPSLIFNLAAETHVDRSIDNPKQFINSNIFGIFNLLEVIRKFKKKIKLIHISTDEIYGDIVNNKSSIETDPYNPSSPYSSSKASSNLLIRSYIKTFGINAIITNSCNNYGPNQYPEKLIPTIIYNILNYKAIPIYGKGKNEREWIYVEDNCRALIDVAEKGRLGETYNIGSGKIFTNLEIAKKIINIIGYGKIKFVKDRPGHDLRYSLNSDKIKKQIKWKPFTNIDEGLKTTITWYNVKYKSNFFKNKEIGKRLGLLK